MTSRAFMNTSRWWIYRNENGTWEISSPGVLNQVRYYEYPTGAEALAAFARGHQ